MTKLQVAPNLALPEEAVTWVISYVAKRGAGKTYNASVQAEEMLKAKIPIVVIDGMGIWWGLRVSYDGKSEGLPVVVFGGEHADLPLVAEKATEMAKAIVESNISCVLDLSGFAKYTARKIITPFLNELYRLNRADRHVFIEESDLWAPQRPMGDEILCLGAVDNFVRRGGNHNLGCTLITQRSAVLNKDILTQSDCLVILRTLAPQDKKAIQLWVEEQTDKEKKQLNEWYDSLKSLENGEAWVWHPEKPTIYQKVKFRRRETFHATREFIRSPQASKITLMDVDDFIQKFKNVFEPKPQEIQKPQPTRIALEKPLSPIMGKMIEDSQVISKWSIVPHVSEAPQKPQEQIITVNQTLPNIEIQQFKPTLTIPVEALEQPTTALGKTLVVLKNEPRLDRWTPKKIKEKIEEHGWTNDGTDEAITQLVIWEVLRKQSNNYYYFYSKRVAVTENNSGLMIK